MAKARDPNPKVVPIGEPLNWTPEELDRLSQVTEEDKAAARAFWRRQAPAGPMKKLLDAKKKRKP
jgi:hypothetical protein